MTAHKSLIVVLLCLLPRFCPGVILPFTSELPCIYFLKSALFDVTRINERNPAAFGPLSTFGELLSELGVDTTRVEEIMQVFQSLRAVESNDPVLSDVQGIVEHALENPNEARLLLCVLSENCGWPFGGDAVFLAPNISYGTAIMQPPLKRFAIAAWKRALDNRTIPTGGLFAPIYAVALRRAGHVVPRLDDAVHNSTALWHELAHVHDFQLVSQWVAANKELIVQADPTKPPDDLFLMNVAPVEGKIIFQAGFLAMLFEGRGYHLFNILDDLIFELTPTLLTQRANRNRRIAVENVQEISPRYLLGFRLREGDTPVVVNSANIFSLSMQMANIMRDTIRRANL